MNKALAVGMLVAGVVLLVFGFNASQSISSDFARVFTGNPTEKSIWLLVGGALLAVIGLAGLLRKGRTGA